MNPSFLRRCGAVLLLALGMAGSAHAADDFLDPADAFKLSAQMLDGRTIAVTYDIADGYYMYRERFKFSADGATLGTPVYPPGQVKFDDTFQKNVETFHHSVTVRVPVQAHGMFTLHATGQGCADAGLCYAPQTVNVRLVGGTDDGATAPTGVAAGGAAAPATGSGAAAGTAAASNAGTARTADASPVAARARAPAGAGGAVTAPAAPAAAALPAAAGGAAGGASPVPAPVLAGAAGAGGAAGAAGPAAAAGAARAGAPTGADASGAPADGVARSDDSRVGHLLAGGRLLAIVPAFILLGLGLAFTPCVLPMVPILSSMIVGEGAGQARSRGFLLALAYSLGMALVYTALGVAAGLLGEGLAAALQNGWVLGAFGLLLVAMALSMFGFYELQLPSALQTRLAVVSGRQRGGKVAGVFIMGALSALIVGPCVAAPLAGALVYIGHTHNVLVGGAALFSMAMGMSIPLLLVGLSAGALLPRTGAWMVHVKRAFGVLILGMALWLVSPVLPAPVQMLGWTALLLGAGAWLLRAGRHWLPTAVGAACMILGAVQLVGLVSGARDPLAPLAALRGAPAAPPLAFARIRTSAELDARLAALHGQTALLDFYADWCVSCKEMEKLTFTDARVHAALAGTVLLQVDVTANNADDQALLKRFGLFGPPGIILFAPGGRELPDSRVIGFQAPERFLTALARLR